MLTISEALTVLSYKQSLTFSSYRTLAEWLDCYAYILPADQELRESALYIPPVNRFREAYISLWAFHLQLQNHCTQEEQSNIIRYIQCQPTPPILGY